MNAYSRVGRGAQRGMALVISLVLLIVLSLTALAAMKFVATQSRVASNSWNAQMSLATGEGALVTAENQLLSGVTPRDFAANAHGAYRLDWNNVPQWAQSGFAWSGSNVLPAVIFSNSLYPKSTAHVVAEQLPSVAAPGQSLCGSAYGCNGGILHVFRVTANAVGPDGKLPVLLQDTSVE